MTPPRYGCWGHAPYRPHILLDGDYKIDEHGDLVREVIRIPFRMAMGCEYKKTELGKDDPKCVGCTWKDWNEKN